MKGYLDVIHFQLSIHIKNYFYFYFCLFPFIPTLAWTNTPAPNTLGGTFN